MGAKYKIIGCAFYSIRILETMNRATMKQPKLHGKCKEPNVSCPHKSQNNGVLFCALVDHGRKGHNGESCRYIFHGSWILLEWLVHWLSVRPKR